MLFEKLAEALAYMQKRGVKHRDLKPANIMVRRHDGQPVIVDYGAADRTGAETLTEERLPPGTPRHTSPEANRFDREHRHEPARAAAHRRRGGPLSAATDKYHDTLAPAWPARGRREHTPSAASAFGGAARAVDRAAVFPFDSR